MDGARVGAGDEAPDTGGLGVRAAMRTSTSGGGGSGETRTKSGRLTSGAGRMASAVSGMMNILRRHRVQVDPSFTVVHIALLVAEGLGKQLDPELDMVPLAAPYLVQAMMIAPPGRTPAREPPPALPAAA